MSKWKPWQQFAFLGYLLLLNLIIFGTLVFFLLKSFSNSPQPTAIIVAAPPSDSLAVFATITPGPQVAQRASATSIPPLNIPPAPIPQQTEATTVELEQQPIAIAEGSRSQAWTITPSASTPIFTTTATAQAVAVAQLKVGMPRSLATATSTPKATYTPTPEPTATPTQTPQPTATPTRTPTNSPTPEPTATSTQTPQPTATPTRTPTNTPQPTATPTHIPTQTPRPTVLPTNTHTPTPPPTLTPTHIPIPTFTPTRVPTQVAQSVIAPIRPSRQAVQPTTTSTRTPTQTPQATKTATVLPTSTPSATATVKPTHSPTPPPTARPTQEPTPLVVAAALKGNTVNPPPELPAARLIPSDPAIANTAGLVDAIALTNASIALSWTPVGKTVQYRIYSDMGSGYGVYIHKADVKEAAFVDDMLRPGMVYSYRVTHLEADQERVLAQTDTATFGNQAANTPSSQQPTSTAAVAPAPTALPPDAVLLGLLSDNSFTDEFNTLNIVGEVRNDSNLDVGQTDIAVTFYDAAGAVVGTAAGETMLDVIPPGEISPFLLTLSRPPGMVSYSLRAVARPVTPELNAQLAVVEVKRYEDEAGFFHIRGIVKNTGSIVAKRTKVVATIYGRGGGVINVGFTYVNPPTLAPGEQARYEVIFTYFPKYVSQKVIPFEE